jgi:hypothetical protein
LDAFSLATTASLASLEYTWVKGVKKGVYRLRSGWGRFKTRLRRGIWFEKWLR